MFARLLILIPLLTVLCACAPQASRVYVDKSDRVIVLYDHKNKPMRQYKIALGPQPEGHKMMLGDGRTPEGQYLIDWRNPKSRYHKSLHISYPNEEDVARAQAMGAQPGHSIMIHGLGDPKTSYRRYGDWTEGCIAVSNREMNEIWTMVPDQTPIFIAP